MALGDGDTWNEAQPTNSSQASQIDDYNRDLRVGVRKALDKEHECNGGTSFNADETGGVNKYGRHKYISLQDGVSNPPISTANLALANSDGVLFSDAENLYWYNATGTSIQITNASGLMGSALHFVSGLRIPDITSGTTVTIQPGAVHIANQILSSTANDTSLDVNTSGDFAGTDLSASSGFVYVYAYNNSGTLAFKLSGDAPDESDASGNTDGYHRYMTVSTVPYRFLGSIYKDSANTIYSQYREEDGYVQFSTALSITGSPSTLTIPATTRKANVLLEAYDSVTVPAYSKIRPNGSSGTYIYSIAQTDGGAGGGVDKAATASIVLADTSQQIETSYDESGTGILLGYWDTR